MQALIASLLLFCLAPALAAADDKEAMRQVVPCFTLADRTRIAAHLFKSGEPKDALKAQLTSAFAGVPPAELERHKAALDQAFVDQPADTDAYVVEKLNQCVAGTSSANKQQFSKACYEVTVHASGIYKAKQQGLVLEQVKATAADSLSKAGVSQGYIASVQNMASAIYSTNQPEQLFRARWFASCMVQSQ